MSYHDLPSIPHADGYCATCGNPSLIVNTRHPVDGRLPMPDLAEGAIACCLEDCPALYQPVERGSRLRIGFLGEEHPQPVVVDGEVWPDAQEAHP